MFSYFLPPITNTRPALSVTLEEVYEMIISEKWAQTTRSLRSLRKGEQADFKRRQLPFVTFSGIFSARHSEHIVRHSGLMCFDFDHVGDEIAVRKLQQLLVADPTLNVQLAFRSPSGDGLKVVVECFSLTDNANKLIRWHNAQYVHIASYIEQRYNVKVDKTNDIARACFLCHDPKAYYNSQLKKSVLSVGDKTNSDAKKSVEIQRALLTKSNSESLNPNGKKSFKSVLSVGDNHSEGVTSVKSVSSVREKENSVRDKKISVRDKENTEASPASKSVESVERFSRSERANKSSPPVLGGVPEPTVLSRMAKNGGGGLLSVSSVNQRSLSLWREKSVGDKSNSDAKKSVEIQRALLTKSNSESLNPNGKKSFKSVLSVGNNHSEGVTSVGSVDSVRDKENAEASPASKSVEIQRALLTKSNSESLNPNGKKSFKSVNQRSLSLWREKSVGDNHSEGVTSVRSVSSVRDKEKSVRDKENAEASPASKSVEIQRALLTKSNSESLNPNGKKSFKSVNHGL